MCRRLQFASSEDPVEMSETAKPVQDRSIAKKQRILDAAAKTLATRGYAQTTLTEIARLAGAQAANIFYYFPSREDLVKEVLITSLKRMNQNLVAAIEELGQNVSPLACLTHAIRSAVLHHLSAKDQYTRAYTRSFNQVPKNIVQEIDAERHVTRAFWARVITAAKEAGELAAGIDVNLATFLVLGATNWVSVWYKASGPQSRTEIADHFTEMLIAGLTGAKDLAAPLGKFDSEGG